jgi:hypothetical protein
MSFVMPDPHAGGWLGASNYEGGSPWVWDDGSALDYTLLQYASPSQGVIYAYPSGVLYISATSSTVAAKYPICSKVTHCRVRTGNIFKGFEKLSLESSRKWTFKMKKPGPESGPF